MVPLLSVTTPPHLRFVEVENDCGTQMWSSFGTGSDLQIDADTIMNKSFTKLSLKYFMFVTLRNVTVVLLNKIVVVIEANCFLQIAFNWLLYFPMHM